MSFSAFDKLKKFWFLLVVFIGTFHLSSLVVEAIMADSKEFMSGKVLRIGLIHFPPTIVITKGPNNTFSFSGPVIDELNYMAQALNISYEFIILPPEEMKKYGIGPVQMNRIINGEIDMAPFGIIPSPEKYQIIDMSVPVMIEKYYIVVPWPKEESRLLAPIRPFQPIVWLSLGLCLLVLAPVLAFLSGFYHKYIKAKDVPIANFNSVVVHGMFLLSHLTNHGFHIRLKSRATYVAVSIWCLMTVVLANGYAGTLFSFLSVAKLEPPINSLRELANSNDIKLLVMGQSEYAKTLLAAKSGPEKLIGDTLRNNPDNFISTMAEIKIKLATGKYSFVNYNLYTKPLIEAAYKQNGKKCQLTMAKEPISMFIPTCNPMAKNGPYTTAINEQVQALLESGLLNFYLNKVTPRVDQCLMQNNRASSTQKSLSLVDMSSAFVIFGLGITLSILVFLLELFYSKIKDNYFN